MLVVIVYLVNRMFCYWLGVKVLILMGSCWVKRVERLMFLIIWLVVCV